MNFAATNLHATVLVKSIPVDQITGDAVLTAADFAGCIVAGVVAFNAQGAAAPAVSLLTTAGAVAAGCTEVEWLQIVSLLDVQTALFQNADISSLVFTSALITLTYDLLNIFGVTSITVFYFQVI